MRTSDFSPWKWQLKWGAGLIAFGALGIYMWSQAIRAIPAWVIMVSIAAGIVLLRQGWRRYHGALVEGRMVEALTGIAPDNWKVEPDIPTPFGNCDAAVTDSDGYRYAVEIKSKVAVEIRAGLFRAATVQYARGNPVPDLVQACNNAHYLKAVPVIWYPSVPRKRYRTAKVKVDGVDVIVVAGGAKQLVKAIERF